MTVKQIASVRVKQNQQLFAINRLDIYKEKTQRSEETNRVHEGEGGVGEWGRSERDWEREQAQSDSRKTNRARARDLDR